MYERIYVGLGFICPQTVALASAMDHIFAQKQYSTPGLRPVPDSRPARRTFKANKRKAASKARKK